MWEDEWAEEMRSDAPGIFWHENYVPEDEDWFLTGKYLKICTSILMTTS